MNGYERAASRFFHHVFWIFDTRVGVVNILVLDEQLVYSDHPTVEFFFCLARLACDSVQFPLEIDGFFFV